jgi:hypothetical protein
VRAWLETDMPPVFGKEMERQFEMADTPNTDISHFCLISQRITRISPNITNAQIFDPFVAIRVIRRQI